MLFTRQQSSRRRRKEARLTDGGRPHPNLLFASFSTATSCSSYSICYYRAFISLLISRLNYVMWFALEKTHTNRQVVKRHGESDGCR